MADLHFTSATSTDHERRAVDAVLPDDVRPVVFETDRFVRGGVARRRRDRQWLLPALHALQAEIGWISPGGLNYVSERLQVPPAEAYGVATFYEMFRTDPPGHEQPVVHVCVDGPCHAQSSATISRLEAAGSHTHRSPCLGQCDRPPGVFIQGRGEPDSVPGDPATPVVHSGDGVASTGSAPITRRVGVVDPSSLDSYRAHDGYTALELSIALGADEVLDAIESSGLSGRGGAAFPTAAKWRSVAAECSPVKYVVANCDESEPGTFKDRIMMESDPFALIEAMTIAGLTVGAEQGWIYIRGEYPLATRRLAAAVDQARRAGLLGANVGGSGRTFDIEIRRGAGAYICGEETALFNSIEGFRGEPRTKPPFPTTHGLFGQPTVVQNPETLLNVLPIVLDGPAAYRRHGTERSPGTKLLCLSGAVHRPGLYEVEYGTTLGEALAAAGGCTGTLRAVLIGGAAGSFVAADSLDLRLSLEDTQQAGTTLGSGVIMAFDDAVDLTPIVVRIAEFFRNESCGQCVPCRVGTVRQHEVMVQLQRQGSLTADRLRVLDDLAAVMSDASICGLGHTASGAVQSALRLGLVGNPS